MSTDERGGPTADDNDLATARVAELEDGGDATSMFATHGFSERYAGGALLGVGGMGEVRLYRDRLSGRSVAAKMMRTDGRGSSLRFAREARIQSQLEHPAIVPVYDLGADERGAFYFTMKRVRGDSLERVLAALREGRVEIARRYSPRRLLQVLATVAMAVEFAHERGVIHRDLKPSNIMLGPFGEVYVLDWGLAFVGDVDQTATRVNFDVSSAARIELPALPLVDSSQPPTTAAGQILGTPGYLAPEQVRPGPVDRRCDVYALGVILFEILAVRRLHVGATLAEVLVSTLSLDGASPLAKAPECGAPPELDALCQHATRRDPADRLRDAAALASRIEAYLDGDRDLAQRRVLAASRATSARQALDRATGDADDGPLRRAALRDLSAALALDPDNQSARGTLLRLLTEPSRAAQEAAGEAERTDARAAFRLAARNAVIAHLTFALYLPIVFAMGVRHVWMLVLMAAAIASAAAVSYVYYRRPPSTSRVPLPLLFSSAVALLTGATMFGPLLMLPTVVLAAGVVFTASVDRRHALITVAAIAVVLVPSILQAVGVLPPSYEFDGDALRIRAVMVSLPEAATTGFLMITNVVFIVVCNLFVSQLRRHRLDVERRVRAQACQLAELVPDAASVVPAP